MPYRALHTRHILKNHQQSVASSLRVHAADPLVRGAYHGWVPWRCRLVSVETWCILLSAPSWILPQVEGGGGVRWLPASPAPAAALCPSKLLFSTGGLHDLTLSNGIARSFGSCALSLSALFGSSCAVFSLPASELLYVARQSSG